MKAIPPMILSALVVSVSAGACPVKPGYVGNGLMKMPAGLTADCGVMYKSYKSSAISSSQGVVKWAELYKTSASRAKAVMSSVDRAIQQKGYKLAQTQTVGGGLLKAYANVTSGKVFLVQMIKIGDLQLLNFAGS